MSDTGRENDPFAAFESDRTVIKPGTGNGQPWASTDSTAITWSAFQAAGFDASAGLDTCHIVLERAAPTNACAESGL